MTSTNTTSSIINLEKIVINKPKKDDVGKLLSNKSSRNDVNFKDLKRSYSESDIKNSPKNVRRVQLSKFSWTDKDITDTGILKDDAWKMFLQKEFGNGPLSARTVTQDK